MEIAGECERSGATIRVEYNILIAGVVASFRLVGMTCGVTLASKDTGIDGESML